MNRCPKCFGEVVSGFCKGCCKRIERQTGITEFEGVPKFGTLFM